MIENCIKIPIYKTNSEKEFKENNYGNIYKDIKDVKNQYMSYFLIEYFVKCVLKNSTANIRSHPVTHNNILETDLIYFYGNQFHTEPAKYQLEKDKFVINSILTKKLNTKSEKNEYKQLIVYLLNVLYFGRYSCMVFPKESLESITKFKKFMKDYLFITLH